VEEEEDIISDKSRTNQPTPIPTYNEWYPL
jgi:hypothetical protein